MTDYSYDLLVNGTVTTAATNWTTSKYFLSSFDVAAAAPAPAPTPPETPEQWLRRRVAEVCWTPA